MLFEDDALDPVWKALANATRRGILDVLREAPRNTGEIAACFPDLTRFAVMQHLKVLVEANLVTRRKRGREQVHFLNPVPIQQIYHRWVRNYEGNWAETLIGLKATLEERESEEEGKKA
ncbi:MAG: metalloregulator ArsR/SmtB family transcription factor [Pseudomonadota bacterium]